MLVSAELALRMFLFFCMKLGEHKWKKVTVSPPKGSKMFFLGFLEKTANVFAEML